MISHEEMVQIAHLSKLYLPEESLALLSEEIDRMVALADTIAAAVPPEGQKAVSRPPLELDQLRGDAVTPSLLRERLLQNADGGENGYFAVRRGGRCP